MLVTTLSSTSSETRMKHWPCWEGMEFSTRKKYLFQPSFERIMMSGDVIYVNSFMLNISSSTHDNIHDLDPTVTTPKRSCGATASPILWKMLLENADKPTQPCS